MFTSSPPERGSVSMVIPSARFLSELRHIQRWKLVLEPSRKSKKRNDTLSGKRRNDKKLDELRSLCSGTSTPSAGNAIRSIGGRDSAEEGGLAEQITKAVDTTNLFRLVEAIEANKATLKRVAEGSSFAKAAQDLANAQSAYKNLFPDNSFSRKAKEFAEAQSAYKDLFPDNSVGKVVQGSAGRRATDNRALDSDKAATPGPDGGSPNSQPNDDPLIRIRLPHKGSQRGDEPLVIPLCYAVGTRGSTH